MPISDLRIELWRDPRTTPENTFCPKTNNQNSIQIRQAKTHTTSIESFIIDSGGHRLSYVPIERSQNLSFDSFL